MKGCSEDGRSIFALSFAFHSKEDHFKHLLLQQVISDSGQNYFQDILLTYSFVKSLCDVLRNIFLCPRWLMT